MRPEKSAAVPLAETSNVPRVRTTEDVITQHLREAIVSGELLPGERLNQLAIAELFQVSRIPIRNALQRLAAEGLVTVRAHRTATVTELSLEELEEIYAIRGTLEGVTAEIATESMTSDRIDALASIVAALDHTRDRETWIDLNQRFHATIYAAAGRPRTVAIIRQLRQLSGPYIKYYLVEEAYRSQAQVGHHRILAACRDHEPASARIETEKHLAQVIAGVRDLAVREGGLRPTLTLPRGTPAE